MAVRSEDSSHPPLTFVACVSDEKILGANLLASACLAPGSRHEVILVKNCQNAAEGLNLGIARARHAFVVCLHQDVYLPPGWDRTLIQQLEAAARQFGPIGVAGVYGVSKPLEMRPDKQKDAAAERAQPAGRIV